MGRWSPGQNGRSSRSVSSAGGRLDPPRRRPTVRPRVAAGSPGERGVVVAALAVEADDVVGGDVERGPLLAVVALELAGLEAALDEDAVALAELLGGALGAVAEDADAEPVGALVDPAALVVGLAVADGDGELGHRPAAGGVAHLRVAAQVADDHDLAERHREASVSRWRPGPPRSRIRRSARDVLVLVLLVRTGREHGLVVDVDAVVGVVVAARPWSGARRGSRGGGGPPR